MREYGFKIRVLDLKKLFKWYDWYFEDICCVFYIGGYFLVFRDDNIVLVIKLIWYFVYYFVISSEEYIFLGFLKFWVFV